MQVGNQWTFSDPNKTKYRMSFVPMLYIRTNLPFYKQLSFNHAYCSRYAPFQWWVFTKNPVQVRKFVRHSRRSYSEKSIPCMTGSGRGFGLPKQKDFPYTGTLRPGKQSPARKVPASIPKPDYAKTGFPGKNQARLPWDIEVHNEEDIEQMKFACRVAREVLDEASKIVKPGITTDKIDAVVHEETIRRGAYPSPLNYYNFPKSCCTSVNEVICHGIPDNTVLKNGDIINVDVTCYINGFHGDCSATFLVGEVSENAKRLVRVTYECLVKAIKICKPGVPYNKIGEVIEDYATREGFSVVRNFCGHGIGRIFHTSPNIIHHRNRENNGTMREGHIFTIEPMINEGAAESITWPDKWTATTVDGKLSAQFEHTLVITNSGVDVLTKRTKESPLYFWETSIDEVEF